MTIDDIRPLAARAGADAVGVARCAEVDADAQRQFAEWIGRGDHAAMRYMTEHSQLRNDPRLLLEGAESIIVMAFSYYSDTLLRGDVAVARYARGADYHNVLRKRLQPIVRALAERYGAESRITVDSAPMRERYWAVRAGLGFVGRNAQLIVPSVGSYCFIATVITTAAIEPTAAYSGEGCGECRRCVNACPGGALRGEIRSVDSRRCLSYLTVEGRHLGDADWPDGVRRPQVVTFGCDVCQDVCPYNNRPRQTSVERFNPMPAVINLTSSQLKSLDREQLLKLLEGSPLRRALK